MDAREVRREVGARGVEVRSLSVSYGENKVFSDFDITFPAGEISVVMGGSGVGKSTLLGAIAGLVPYGGEVIRPSGGISYIFQKDRLIPSISVRKNLDLVLRKVFRDKEERSERIAEMLKRLEIGDKAEKYPTELSGGESLRVAMARAFLFPSEVLLMDEPFRALDIGLKLRLFEELFGLLEESRRTVVYVTHDPEECLRAADGWTVLAGAPARIAGEGRISLPKEARVAGADRLDEERAALTALLSDKIPPAGKFA